MVKMSRVTPPVNLHAPKFIGHQYHLTLIERLTQNYHLRPDQTLREHERNQC